MRAPASAVFFDGELDTCGAVIWIRREGIGRAGREKVSLPDVASNRPTCFLPMFLYP